MPIAYIVTATLPDKPTADEYIAWLREGHVDQVVAAGARSGLIVRLDGEPPRVETHYLFPDRAALDHYIRAAAPALRADGLSRFPPSRGVSFERRIGEIL